jgi:hypothetical protein
LARIAALRQNSKNCCSQGAAAQAEVVMGATAQLAEHTDTVATPGNRFCASRETGREQRMQT